MSWYYPREIRTSLRVAVQSGVIALPFCVAAHAATPSQAGEAPADSGGPALEEVVVTAQKRTQRLQDVPVAVTAVSGEALQNRQITDTNDLTQIVPSLTYQQGNNPSNSTFRIRGLGTALFGQGTESDVSVVLDGVVLARQAEGFTDLADIERVEVLRGPQGTLFGKNATAGLINVVTAAPSKELSGSTSFTVAQDNEYRVNETLAGPLSDTLSGRLTSYYNYVGGYIDNLTRDDEANGYHSWGARGKLEWDATERLKLLFTASYNQENAECCQSTLIRSDNAALTQLSAPAVPRPYNTEVVSNLPVSYNTKEQLYSLNTGYDVGFGTVTSITAYQHYAFTNNVDFDGLNTPVPIFTGPSFAQFDVNGGPIALGEFSEELRMASSGENRLNYVAGVYFDSLGLDRAFSRRLAQCPAGNPKNAGLTLGADCPAPAYASGGHTAHLSSKSYAAFGQLDYGLIGGLKAIAGLRVQHDTQSVHGHRTGLPLVAGDAPLFGAIDGTVSTSDSGVSGRTGLQYQFDKNAQVYATYSRGFKGKGLDTEVTANFVTQQPVRPETVNSYEVGFKGVAWNHRFETNVALFLADYTNLQIQANRSDPASGNFVFVQTNAGASRSKGAEFEANWLPLDNLTVGMSADYVDASINANGLNCPLQYQAAAVAVPVGGAQPYNTCFKQALAAGGFAAPTQNVRGGSLPLSPKWQFSLHPRYEWKMGGYMAFADVNVAYQGSEIFAVEQNPLLRQGAYTIVDASIGLHPQLRGFFLTFFVKNLFDRHFYTSMGTNSLLTTAALTPDNLTGFMPKNAFRYVGGTIGYSF
jgi:iron complex outermembrane receptor protein